MRRSVSIPTGVANLPTHCWPTDKAAARELWAPAPELFTTKTCPPLCPVSVAEIQRRNQGWKGRPGEPFRDLTGQRSGAMTIIGLREYREKRRSSWIARCDCGNYEQRNHRNWQKYHRHGVPDACGECMGSELRKAVIAALLKKSGAQRQAPAKNERPLAVQPDGSVKTEPAT